MTDETDRNDIEADIAQERSALAQSLSDLADEFSPERLIGSVGEALKTQGDDLTQAVVRGARENPAALAVVGAGLAWLLLGTKRGNPPERPYATDGAGPIEGFRHEDSPLSFEDRVAAAQAAAQQPPASDVAQAGPGDQLKRSATEMRQRLYDGTHELSDLARERVIAARQLAITAQEALESQAHSLARRGRGVFRRHPLAVGAGLAAAGAAAAFALPRTRAEDSAFGHQRDILVAEAERILREELSRRRNMAQAALSEAQAMAREAVDDLPSGQDAVNGAESHLRHAANRVGKAAQNAKAH